jgi:hypothetical protein
MLTAELPYRGKRDTLSAVIKLKNLPPDQLQKLNGYLGKIHKWSGLRNAIAHRTWTHGVRPDSIKPFGISVREGEATFIGFEGDERDYTAEELIVIANDVTTTRSKLIIYLKSVDLLPNRAPDDGAE